MDDELSLSLTEADRTMARSSAASKAFSGCLDAMNRESQAAAKAAQNQPRVDLLQMICSSIDSAEWGKVSKLFSGVLSTAMKSHEESAKSAVEVEAYKTTLSGIHPDLPRLTEEAREMFGLHRCPDTVDVETSRGVTASEARSGLTADQIKVLEKLSWTTEGHQGRAEARTKQAGVMHEQKTLQSEILASGPRDDRLELVEALDDMSRGARKSRLDYDNVLQDNADALGVKASLLELSDWIKSLPEGHAEVGMSEKSTADGPDTEEQSRLGTDWEAFAAGMRARKVQCAMMEHKRQRVDRIDSINQAIGSADPEMSPELTQYFGKLVDDFKYGVGCTEYQARPASEVFSKASEHLKAHRQEASELLNKIVNACASAGAEASIHQSSSQSRITLQEMRELMTEKTERPSFRYDGIMDKRNKAMKRSKELRDLLDEDIERAKVSNADVDSYTWDCISRAGGQIRCQEAKVRECQEEMDKLEPGFKQFIEWIAKEEASSVCAPGAVPSEDNHEEHGGAAAVTMLLRLHGW